MRHGNGGTSKWLNVSALLVPDLNGVRCSSGLVLVAPVIEVMGCGMYSYSPAYSLTGLSNKNKPFRLLLDIDVHFLLRGMGMTHNAFGAGMLTQRDQVGAIGAEFSRAGVDGLELQHWPSFLLPFPQFWTLQKRAMFFNLSSSDAHLPASNDSSNHCM